MMDSTTPTEARRLILRLAVAAVIVGFSTPLLPIFGNGVRPGFIFLQGLTWRFGFLYLLKWWGSTLVAAVGIWFLKRDRPGPAGGVFLAVGLVMAIGVVGDLVGTAPSFGLWQTDVLLALEAVEAILLVLAGSRAISVVTEVQTGESPPPESRSRIGD